MYNSFVEEVDAIDNGVSQYDEGNAKYDITSTIGQRVSRLHPAWNDTNQDFDTGFNKVSLRLCISMSFLNHIIHHNHL